MSQRLTDRSGRLIGKIDERQGVLEIRDSSNRLLGKYNPTRNETRDASGRLVGRGNLLTTLL